MPAPELAHTLAYGPCESHDMCEQWVTGQHSKSKIFTVARLLQEPYVNGVPLVAEYAVANGSSGWLDVHAS